MHFMAWRIARNHILFIAEVSNCDYCDNLPLVFFSSRYHLGPGTPVDH
jgi:flavin reductase